MELTYHDITINNSTQGKDSEDPIILFAIFFTLPYKGSCLTSWPETMSFSILNQNVLTLFLHHPH